VRRCPYCDFNSYRAGSSVPEAAYIQALLKDLNYSKVLAGERIAQQRRPTLVKFDVVTSFKQPFARMGSAIVPHRPPTGRAL
jgi:hypothetical protein